MEKNETTWDLAFEKRLLTRATYREFLAEFFTRERQWTSPRPLSYAQFAARAGFASKAFLSDVLQGRKRLTPSSYLRVIEGLSLDIVWSEYLKCLIGLEEADFRSRHENTAAFRKRLQACKKQIRLRQSVRNFKGSTPLVQLFLSEGFPEVYAALGDGESGVAFPEIVARAHLLERDVKSILGRMHQVGLVEILPDGTYLARQGALQARALYSQSVFEMDYYRAIEKAKRHFSSQAGSERALFMVQTFAVQAQDLPRLKSELAQLIERFATEAETANGDCVSEICVAYTSNRG